MLNRKHDKPIYRQIAENLQQDIQRHYQANDCLPSEMELANRFSVNRHTLRRGIDELVSIGLVERVHGKGVYVLDAPIDYTVGKNNRFTENLDALGKSSDIQLLKKLEIKADGNIAKLLELGIGGRVLWIETLRSVDKKPFCLISHYLPLERLGAEINDYQGGSLQAYFNVMGLKPVRLSSTISAMLPRNEDGLLLMMPSYLPVLRIKTVNINTTSRKPIEYSLARFRSDKAQISVDIT